MATDFKPTIVAALETLRKKETADKQVWKARAYSKVIKLLKDNPNAITSFDDVKDLPGIGSGIGKKIKEIIETGHLHIAEEIEKDENYTFIEELMKIHGIGAVKARELVYEKGIKSIADLEIRKDELLNDKQILGLKYHNDVALRIPRKEMKKHEKFIIEAIQNIDPILRVVLTGSYRRGEMNSGDIDALITYPFDYKPDSNIIKRISDELTKINYISDVLAVGEKKCMAVCRLKWHKHYRRVDLMLTKPQEFPFAVLYFTGSQTFNIAMRSYALSKGYSLNEYGLKDVKTDKLMDCRFESEEDVFRFLDLKYVAPLNRSKIEAQLETL